MAEKENLDIRLELVGNIKGSFRVPSYQRGYRWQKKQVNQLLSDLISLTDKQENNCHINYCLQPIVVCQSEDDKFNYDLIDGQQRLTTIYILWKYMGQYLRNWEKNIPFQIDYQTRNKTSYFLENIDNADIRKNAEEYIDFYYMAKAYESIASFFDNKYSNEEEKGTICSKIRSYFCDIKSGINVNFIWYYDESGKPRETFKNLNRGKILLTNSELVKALLLKDKKISDKFEIANAWYSMEKELQNNEFWYFLTNVPVKRQEKNKYQTRIDIVLEMLTNAGIKEDSEDEISYSIFDDIYKNYYINNPNIDLWKDIKSAYQTLKSWYEDKELYHKIGYLVFAGVSLKEIYEECRNSETKTMFKKSILENKIAESIGAQNIIRYEENNEGRKTIVDEDELMKLVYQDAKGNRKENDCEKIAKILLLHNIKTIHFSPMEARFPFDKHKLKNNKQNSWSLEHIDAQNTEGLQDKNEKIQWAKYQKEDLEQLKVILDSKNLEKCKNLQNKLDEFLQNNDLRLFDDLSEKVNEFYNTIAGYKAEKHTIDNLALLNKDDNSALNKSRFGVKRSIIMNYDKKGEYIPYCTRNVFMKYYSLQSRNDDTIRIPQLIYWEDDDRVAYKNDICTILAKDWGKEENKKEKETKEGENNA